MEKNEEVFKQISESLSGHFENVCYVELETGKYIEYSGKKIHDKLDIPKQGDDFFEMIKNKVSIHVHPDDIERMIKYFNRETMAKSLSKEMVISAVFRLILDGEIIRVRHVDLMASDKTHVICCLENIEDEVRREEEQEKDLQSAKRMARRDELTGVRNKNAYQEYVDSIEDNIKDGPRDYEFGVLVCDLNDLKALNDTRGHNFGDEAIQRSCRMICETFSHSPVFRIGGDEFVAVITGRDYAERETSLGRLRGISIMNGRDKTGPVVACGMATYDKSVDEKYSDVFERADKEMYEDKTKLKTMKIRDGFKSLKREKNPITDERKRLLDRMFGAMYTVADGGYIYLTDMKHDFTRFSLHTVDDFGLPSEYMYHAREEWESRMHPEDIDAYRNASKGIFDENSGVNFNLITHRSKLADGSYAVCNTRGFILNDAEGEPEYFGGIILTE